MENLSITELRKKNRHFSIRVSDEERATLEQFCQREQISYTDFFRIAIRKVVNEHKAK